MCGDGKTEREVRRRVGPTGRCELVESSGGGGGVMADRRISKRLKGKVMSTCVTPACLYGTEMLALNEIQQQRLIIVRKQLGTGNSETGVQRSLIEGLVRSRLQWVGHVESMADDGLPKRAAELREEGRRRRGGQC